MKVKLRQPGWGGSVGQGGVYSRLGVVSEKEKKVFNKMLSRQEIAALSVAD